LCSLLRFSGCSGCVRSRSSVGGSDCVPLDCVHSPSGRNSSSCSWRSSSERGSSGEGAGTVRLLLLLQHTWYMMRQWCTLSQTHKHTLTLTLTLALTLTHTHTLTRTHSGCQLHLWCNSAPQVPQHRHRNIHTHTLTHSLTLALTHTVVPQSRHSCCLEYLLQPVVVHGESMVHFAAAAID
jgi:hypothetical protein